MCVGGGGTGSAKFLTVVPSRYLCVTAESEAPSHMCLCLPTGKSMGQKRFTTAAAELNGSIFVTGGYDDQYLSSTERFDPREGRWVSVRPRP